MQAQAGDGQTTADAQDSRIRKAQERLSADAPTIPQGFAATLFGGVPAEDLGAYESGTLAELARAAHDQLVAPRKPGEADIRLLDISVESKGRTRDLTILQIVNDNMPFLLDSALAEIVERGWEPKLVAHPILTLVREPDGSARVLDGAQETIPGRSRRESLIHIHLDRIESEPVRESLLAALQRAYADVAVAVADWRAMRAQAADLRSAYRASPPPLPKAEITEAIAFLDWILDENFIFIGAREYRFGADEEAAAPVEGSGLGVLRDPGVKVLRRGRELVVMTPEIRAFLSRPKALIITKANVKSRVHRRTHYDYVGVKLFGPSGDLEGELRIVGLFTSDAYTRPVDEVPYIRSKIAHVLDRAGFDPASYAGRAFANVLETYPRDELFQIEEEQLHDFALAVMNLSERPRIRVLSRLDQYDRFVSVLVYVPKDRYDTGVRRRVGEFLAQAYDGRISAVHPTYPEGPLARTHYIVGRDQGETPHVPQAVLEEGVAAIVRTWADELGTALVEHHGGAGGRHLASLYAHGFSAAYREAFAVGEAIADIATVERLSEERPRAVDLYRRQDAPETRINLKMFSRGHGLLLSERVPLLENLGFRVVNERTYRIRAPEPAPQVWLHDMSLERAAGGPIEIAEIEARMEPALLAILRGQTESDGFNRLVLEAGLEWHDVAVVRALGRYLRQIRIPYGQDYLADVLARHGAIAAEIVGLFRARFDPAAGEGGATRAAEHRARIEAALQEVTSLDDDRILRRFVNLVEAMLRTNVYQHGEDGEPRPIIAFKFDCARVDELPLPKPRYEIFMNSPRVEALHLRFGKVARGGLRWSDRPQDFRTEVLGLVKAQQVKNAVIVPVGAKGGFFPKQLPPASDRAAWMAEGTESYRIFVRTLLELTDNIEGDAIVPPPDTVRHDDDDPYLVVAADKGTATFSDVANAISLEKGHWLGDAFASGGSHGYDHKAMGITARGAWESVKRHFREMDIDIQSEPVTVAGVGDMSGDVFGNGMLLSESMKLVAAFDHRDIFLDPDPDVAKAFAERRRLFGLQRSSWADYDASLISKGGGIFSRQAKSIPLSPEIRKALDLEAETATPAELMSAILKAPVGLLWFGGIGTYIRASSEADEAVGDRANDAIRIAGADVRAKVIGEGANLGVTQPGRIEAARHGVRLNTDAIDNSAGVNTSDVEVNIKIALSAAERDGRLSFEARNALLAEMTEDVAGLVLRNNYLQTLALSLAERRGASDLGFARRLMQGLEQAGRLDRAVEFLPDEAALAERSQRGEALTRPELAVLLAYAKLALHDALVASPVPDDPSLGQELERYFPQAMRERFPDAIAGHRLRREIIATQLANAIVNRGGPTIVARLVDETGADAPTIAAAYAAVRDSFGLSELNAAIDAQDGKLPGAVQLQLYAELQDLMLSRIAWFIRNVDFTATTLEAVIGLYRDGIAKLGELLPEVIPEAARQRLDQRIAVRVGQGVPDDLARRVETLQELSAAPDIVLVARRAEASVEDAARAHFAVDAALRLGALSEAADTITAADYFDRLALDRGMDAIDSAHRRLTAEVMARDEPADAALEAWKAARGADLQRIASAVEAIVASGLTVSKLTVAASLLGDLAKG